jgi:hypothetical protein
MLKLFKKKNETTESTPKVSKRSKSFCPLLASGVYSAWGRDDKRDLLAAARCRRRCEWFVESENCCVMLVNKNG